ncbi:MAG: hypothetical protein AAGF87_04855 [Bacteroidota bacterium]
MRSSLLWSIFLLIGTPLLRGQYGAPLDSLDRYLSTLEEKDTNYILTLVELWRASSGNDLAAAEGYARDIIDKSRAIDYTKGMATGYQRLGITQAQGGEIDSSMANYRKALVIYEDLDWPGLQGVMLYNIGGNHSNAAAYDSAYHYYQLAADRFALDGNPQRQGAVLLSLCRIDREQHRYARSLEKALEARALFQRISDSIWLADSELELGFANMELEDFPASMSSFKAAADIYSHFQDDYYRQIARINQATVHNLMGQHEASLKLLDSILTETRAAEFIPLEIEALGVLAIMEKEQGLNDQAILHFDRLLEISDPEDDLDARLQALAYSSDLLADMGQYDKAQNRADRVIEPARQKGLLLLERMAQGALVKVAANRGNFRLAYEYGERYEALGDSLTERENLDRLAVIEAEYQTKEQQLEIDRQASELLVLEREQQMSRLRQRAWIFGLLGLTLLVAFMAYSFFQRSKRIRLEQKTEKLIMQNQLNEHQKKLSAHTLHLLQKNQVLDDLRVQLEQINTKSHDRSGIDKMIRNLQSEERSEQDWQSFKVYFEQVHGDFEQNLHSIVTDGKLSSRELRMAALIKVGLNNNELIEMLRMSQDSLYKAKYRLKKKLPIAGTQTLDEYLQSI